MNRRLLLRYSAVLTMSVMAVAAHAQATVAKTDYVLGAGDVMRVTVFQSPELSAEARIPE